MNSLNCDVAIIGAGACGLSLAFCLHKLAPSLDIAVLDSEQEVGKKLARTGNGRCNLANNCWKREFYHSLSWQNEADYVDFWRKFLDDEKLDVLSTVKGFWQNVGVFLLDQADWLYPRFLSAKQLRDKLYASCQTENVHFYLSCKVKSISKQKNTYGLEAVLNEAKLFVNTRYLVWAAGGLSQCNQAATSLAYTALENLHVPMRASLPALVQLQTKPNYLRLTGLRLKVEAKLLLTDGEFISQRGEVLFAKYGLSGIVSMILATYYQQDLAKQVYIPNECKQKLSQAEQKTLQKHLKRLEFLWPKFKPAQANYLLLNLLDELTDADILDFIRCNSACQAKFKTDKSTDLAKVHLTKALLDFLLSALLPSKLMAIIEEQLEQYWPALTQASLANLLYYLRNWPLIIQSTLSLKEAQVSLGGVDLKAINPRDFSLQVLENCYVGGEMLDLVGDCGGYNLMLAIWSAIRISESILTKEKHK